MFRFTAQRLLLHQVRGGSSVSWAPRSAKRAQRHSKEALQLSRQRYHLQRENERIRQSVNLNYIEQRRVQGKSREFLAATAYGLIHKSSKGENRNARQQQYYSPQDRAEDMATARHLLMMEETKRQEMKRGRTQRLEMFRSMKRR
ncbi:unnamed protein product [Phytomonas sp. EM1]|nr:unnamed protein product [Phytomonas sp. EM1]|eukprot:CCW60242.1 unnamed protein product [Phytomonas sp. isolate EM1]